MNQYISFGIIFMLSLWIWSVFFGFQHVWFLLAVTLIAGVSFVDDICSLSDSVRLVAQFVAMAMMFYQLDILHWNMWWMVLVALVMLAVAYVLFMRKYYHLHEEYLASLKK